MGFKEGRSKWCKQNEGGSKESSHTKTSQSEDDAFRNVFVVNKEIKNLELRSTKDPCVKVTIVEENREKLDELKASINTGSHVSLTSQEYALKRDGEYLKFIPDYAESISKT